VFAARLAKPVKQSDLLDAIVTAFASPSGPHHVRTHATHRRHRASTRSMRVLVAEDNRTNQKLIEALLKQKGHHVSMVGNGREAAARASKRSFDVILMDVQMPEMSGLEATAAIREHEGSTGRHTPIIALTARAMAGDREEYLAAGMDGYVSKPLRPDELFSTIDALCAPRDGKKRATRARVRESSGAVDRAVLVEAFGGRPQLVKEVIDVFLEDATGMMARLRDATRAQDASEVAAAAHAIKGSAGLFSQGQAYDTARRLEQLARAGDLTTVDAACTEVEGHLSALMAELRALGDTLK